MGDQFLRFHKRQFHRPIVRQIDPSPCAVVEVRQGRRRESAGLCKRPLIRSEAEVLGWIAGMAKMKAPVEIEQQTFAGGSAIRCL